MSTTGIERIAAERQRQIDVEGYTAEHDADENGDGSLALAAACYATPAHHRQHVAWPWAPRYWKPTPEDRVRELVKAGALIAAAIDAEIARVAEVTR